MNRFLKHLADATIFPIVKYARRRIRSHAQHSPHSVASEVLRRAVADSADYADTHMREALCIRGLKAELWRYAFAARTSEGLVIEFGVFEGESIRYFAWLTKETVYGFDSFEGLKEDWKGWAAVKGTFDKGGTMPRVPANVVLLKGWFDATLPPFLREHRQPFSFVHVDCDTYESTCTILGCAGDRFRSGTVVVFDEYFGYRGWRGGEWKAWQEFVAARGLSYRYLAFHDQAAALVVT